MSTTYEQEMESAVKLWAANRFEEADATLSAILLDFPNDVSALAMRSSVRIPCGRLKESMKDALRCVELDTRWYKGYACVAHAKEALGDITEARKYLETALTMSPLSTVLQKYKLHLDSVTEKKTSVETEDVHVPEAPELLRQHIACRVRWAKVPIHRSEGPQEMRRVMRLLYDLARRVEDHPRVAFAMADLCDSIACRSEAYAIRRDRGLEQKHPPDEQMESVDVCFSPTRVNYVPEMFDDIPKDSQSITRTFAFIKEVLFECTNITPHGSLLVNHKELQGHIAVLVFRHPTKFVVRVSEASCMGLSEHSCMFLVTDYDNCAQLTLAAEAMTTTGYGASWVWLYAEEDHFTPGPRGLRDSSSCAIAVRRGTFFHVSRKNLEWHLRHVKIDKAKTIGRSSK